jgi:tripartite ATP-independent transporter DctP family solute receptor
MRKLFTVAVVLSVLFALLAAVPAGAATVITVGDVTTEGTPNIIAFRYFEQLVEERSNGEIDVQVYPASQLGNQRDLVEGLQLGTVDICNSMSGILSAYLPEIQVFDLPYIWTGREHFYRVLDGEVGTMFKTELLPQFGFEGLAFFDGGIRSIYNSKHPINTPEDVKGLKIRVPEIPMYIKMIEALGGSATPIATGEIYSALQTGIVDGVENAPIFVNSHKHYEICKYYSYTNHIETPDIILMSNKVYDKLSAEHAQLIKDCMLEAQTVQREEWLRQENEVVETLKAEGMEFNEVDPAPFREAVQSVWAEYADVIGQDLIDKVANG